MSWSFRMNVRDVVIGLVFNVQREVLIALRPPTVVSPGLWEFPGGKVENGETLHQALIREYREEIGIEIIDAKPFLKIKHDKPDETLILHSFQILSYQGEPIGRENQIIRWASIDSLHEYNFLPANAEIIQRMFLLS